MSLNLKKKKICWVLPNRKYTQYGTEASPTMMSATASETK